MSNCLGAYKVKKALTNKYQLCRSLKPTELGAVHILSVPHEANDGHSE